MQASIPLPSCPACNSVAHLTRQEERPRTGKLERARHWHFTLQEALLPCVPASPCFSPFLTDWGCGWSPTVFALEIRGVQQNPQERKDENWPFTCSGHQQGAVGRKASSASVLYCAGYLERRVRIPIPALEWLFSKFRQTILSWCGNGWPRPASGMRSLLWEALPSGQDHTAWHWRMVGGIKWEYEFESDFWTVTIQSSIQIEWIGFPNRLHC